MRSFTAFWLLCLLGFFSCTVDFEDNTRLLFKTSLQDQFGEPVPDASVQIYGEDAEGGYPVRRALLGEGFSDEQGEIAVTFLKPKNLDVFEILINQPNQEEGRLANYGALRISRTFENLPENKFEPAPLTIDKLAEYKVSAVNNGQPGDTLGVELSYKSPFKSIPEGEYVFPAPGIYSFTLLSQESTALQVTPALGEEVTLEYTVRNKGLVDQGVLLIPVTQAQQEFRYEYP